MILHPIPTLCKPIPEAAKKPTAARRRLWFWGSGDQFFYDSCIGILDVVRGGGAFQGIAAFVQQFHGKQNLIVGVCQVPALQITAGTHNQIHINQNRVMPILLPLGQGEGKAAIGSRVRADIVTTDCIR